MKKRTECKIIVILLIVTSIMTNVMARFHWVRCQLDTLTNCQNLRDIKTALEALPKDLNETYARILLKISEREETASVAEKILRWLVGSMRPLGLLELEEVLMIEPGMAELNEKLHPRGSGTAAILVSCGSLVEEFEDEGGLRRVRISHYTVHVSIGSPYLYYSTK